MVEVIEYTIRKEKPNYIFTHSPSDNNSDHYWCCQAVLEACRLGQRGGNAIPPIDGLYFMEVLSSTDWGINASLNPFRPNTFVEVTEADIDTKISALKVYENVIRPNPFPRSTETIFALAHIRGSQGGYKYAEAFQCVFRRGI
jgi:LmbE family N-acetylglucosaminyl deacetylase